VGAIDAAALGHSRNMPMATDEKTTKIFSILVMISLVGAISEKSLTLLPPDVTC